MGHKIVFLDKGTIGPGVTVRQPSFEHDWEEYDQTSAADVPARLKGATIAITNKVPIRADSLAQLPDLQMIAVAATGFDVIDIAACKERGIPVANIRGYAVNTVPEHTFSLILALRRNLVEYRQQVLDGKWVESGQFCFFNRPIWDLAGSTLGIIGAGALGSSIGALGAAFGMTVIYHDNYAAKTPENGELVTLNELRDRADVLTCHCPLTDETRGMIGADFLRGMKETSIVINTARGGIIDEEALLHALISGQIAGAGIDVTTPEPPAMDSTIMKIAALPNAILTPHVAWAGVAAMQTLTDQLIDNIELWEKGTPQHLVT